MPTVENLEQLKSHLEQIQSEFDRDLLAKLNNLLSQHQGQNVVVTPAFEKQFNQNYNNLVADARQKAQQKVDALDIRFPIDAAALRQVGDILVPYHMPRAREKMALDQSAGVNARQDAGYKAMDAFKNMDESPNDRPQPEQPANLNRDEITSFLNKQTNELKNRLTLKFGMPKPKPGRPEPEAPRLTALPRLTRR